VDASSADVARLLRAFAVRALALAFLTGIMGEAMLTIFLALVGMALLLAPVDVARDGRQDVDP
jgi:hypothetical protein